MPKLRKASTASLKFKKQYMISLKGNDRNYVTYIGKKKTLYLFADVKNSDNQQYKLIALTALGVRNHVYIELEK